MTSPFPSPPSCAYTICVCHIFFLAISLNPPHLQSWCLHSVRCHISFLPGLDTCVYVCVCVTYFLSFLLSICTLSPFSLRIFSLLLLWVCPVWDFMSTFFLSQRFFLWFHSIYPTVFMSLIPATVQAFPSPLYLTSPVTDVSVPLFTGGGSGVVC